MAVIGLPRRVSSFLVLLFLLFVAFFFLSRRDDAWSSIPRPPSSWTNPFTADDGILSAPKDPVRISIVESGGTHDEVTAALVHGFGGMENAELTLFLKHQRYRMEDIMNKFSLVAPIKEIISSDVFTQSIDSSMQASKAPHILVSTTCELDLPDSHLIGGVEGLLANSTTHLFCVIHHADRWAEGKHVRLVREWVDKDRVDFIGLSQHTADFLVQKTVPKWESNTKSIITRAFPPVFPIALPEFDASKATDLSLAMQGDYESARRDYKGIFKDLVGIIQKVKDSATNSQGADSVSLHLIGHGNQPKVPEDVKDHVVFDHDLSYPDFYKILSRAFAALPAFASDTYYDRKASSTVPAALIAGTPLVASEKLLAAYSYLPRDTAFVMKEGERELSVIDRVIGDRQEYLQKRQRMKEACENLSLQNRVNVKAWIDEALAKAGTDSDKKIAS